MNSLFAAAAALLALVQCTPAPGGFGSTVHDTAAACQAALGSLPAALETCYETPLYFSTPHRVCSDSCLAPTIAGARQIAQACTGSPDQLPNYGVYVAWAAEDAAHAACAPASDNRTCLERMSSAMVTADEIILLHKTPTAQQLVTLGCKEACTQAYYKAAKGNAANAPTLYYFGNTRVKGLFAVWKEHCGWGAVDADA